MFMGFVNSQEVYSTELVMWIKLLTYSYEIHLTSLQSNLRQKTKNQLGTQVPIIASLNPRLVEKRQMMLPSQDLGKIQMLLDYISGGHLISFGKKILFLLIFTISANAREQSRETFFGVSTVFKAQVFQSPSKQAKVIDHLNRGEKVKVHFKHFKEKLITNKKEDQNIDMFEAKQGFYQVITKLGNVGYVEKTHIHLIYRDFRDQHYHFKTTKKNDLTDYRVVEPISPTYPLSEKIPSE